MTEQLVSLETAKLLKEKGFNVYCKSYWQNPDGEYWLDGTPGFSLENGTHSDYERYLRSPRYLAPTQSLIQKWLRENEEIHVEVLIEDKNSYCFTINTFQNKVLDWKEAKSKFKTYEEALEKGLQKALNLI